MSDVHDSWLKDAFGLDLGASIASIKDDAAAAFDHAAGAAAHVVQSVQGAVEGALDGVTGAAAGVAKKVAGAVSPSGAKGSGAGAGGGTGSFPLGGSVGRGGRNAANDVRAVQTALGIPADGQCGSQTIAAIEAYQRNLGQAKPDGRVDAGGATERALAGGAKPAAAPTPSPAPREDDSGGLLDRLQKGAAGLIGDDQGLGGKVLAGAKGLLADAGNLGGSLLEDAKGAAAGVLGNPGSLLNDAGGAGTPGGLALTGNFHHELPETKFAEFPATSYVKGSLKFKAEINAEIVKGGKSTAGVKFSGTTNQGGKVDVTVAKQKADELTNETLRSACQALGIKEFKESFGVEISGKKINIDIGITATIASDSVNWLKGFLKGKFVLAAAEWEKLAKDPNDFSFTSFTIEGGASATGVTIPMDDIGIPGHGLLVTVTVAISGSAGPNWGRILAEAGKKAVEQGAKEAGKQLIKGGEVAAIDVAVGAGLVLVAIATVVGTAHSLAVAGEERELVGQVALARNQFETGLFKALKGEANPGGGWLGKGWEAGNRVFQEALLKAQKSFPGALPDEVRQQAINACLTVSKNAEIQPKITRTIGEAYWKNWVAGHHGVTTFLGHAKTACGICFARGPIASNDPDLQAWRDASDLPDALK
jgi:hypothetical protein